MSSVDHNNWFPRPKPNRRARLRLFCFPYAGGSSFAFRRWQTELPDFVEVLPAQFPGRVNRLGETAFTDLIQLVKSLSASIRDYVDKPFVFFGHSMGAMISFELARQLRRERLSQPVHLFVSGRIAPQLPRKTPPVHDLPEPEFVEELRRLNGTPREVLEHPELMPLLIPLLRADFSVVGTYQYHPEPPLACPITALGGLHDPEVSREDLEAWREQTASAFSLRMLPGDHFYLQSAEPLILRVIGQHLCDVAGTGS
jgi:medium-chain acyl-[acyl-carrier-protein] hydrolase